MANKSNGISAEHLTASLSYVGILVLIPLIAGETKNPFIKFHVKQGLGILLGMIGSIFLAQYYSKAGNILFLAFFITTIVAFFQAVQGNKWRIPVIATIAELFPI